ncbi:MAG: hypothetical protein ABJE66_31300 [Deltaproteobacteria bacterium]
MRRLLLLLLLACAPSGCDIVFHIDKIPGGGSGVIDATEPHSDTQNPVCTLVGKYGMGGAGLIRYCVHTDSPAMLDLSGPFDTTANQLCDYQASNGADMNPVCVVPAHVITVTTSLVVTGDKPLVLAALDTITITGSINLTGGGGANPGVCTTTGEGTAGDPSPNGTSGGGGGGGGGSWQTKGGKGGAGKSGIAAPSGALSPAVVDIRGGCIGGSGGGGISGSGGKGGNGGGALYLTAHNVVRVSNTGSINASGRGGGGGIAPDGGAGAGGSGGLIAFDSPTVTFDLFSQPGAKLFANGGGGGAGGNAVIGGTSTDPAVAAPGGVPNGGAGAIGEANGAIGTAGTTSGGGGGGGGQGFIILYEARGVLMLDPNHISPNLMVGI